MESDFGLYLDLGFHLFGFKFSFLSFSLRVCSYGYVTHIEMITAISCQALNPPVIDSQDVYRLFT